MKVAILHGPVSENANWDEKDVLVQVDAVSDALSQQGYEPVAMTFTLDVMRAIETLRVLQPDFVFNLVESVEGSGRLIHLAPAVLDHMGLPYTGASTEALFTTSNKLLAKGILRASGIATPPWMSLDRKGDGGVLPSGLCIIKSAWEHASIGLGQESVVQVEHPHQLLQEMECRRPLLGGECFAEAYIEGREFNLALLGGGDGPQVLPPGEIIFEDYPEDKRRIVCYSAKWDEMSFEYHHTPRLFDFPDSESLAPRLTEIAKTCWQLFGLRGYARVDFRVDREGMPWVLEVNANPCISPDGGFVAAAVHVGLSFGDVVDRIIQDSIPLAIRLPGG